MENNFICCICHQVPSNVVESSCCNSLFCWDCVVAKGGVQQCPSCQGELSPESCTENLAVKKIIEGISLKCNNPGCNEKVSVLTRSMHEEICPKGSILCTNSELCGIMERGNLPSHLLECPYRRTTCHRCEVALHLHQLQDHLDITCMETYVECPNLCSSSTIPRKDIAHHLSHNCAKVEVDCPFAQHGCTVRPLRSAVQTHLFESMVEHTTLMSSIILVQQNQIDSLREQLITTQEAVSAIPTYQFETQIRSFDDFISNFSLHAFNFASYYKRQISVKTAVLLFVMMAIFFRLFFSPLSLLFFLLRLVKWALVGRVGVEVYKKMRRVNFSEIHPGSLVIAFVAAAIAMPPVLGWIIRL